MNQDEPWLRALSIIHKVQQTLGDNLSHDFRSTHTYLTYTALCGEAYHAFLEGELDDALLDLLTGYAEEVITLHEDWPD